MAPTTDAAATSPSRIPDSTWRLRLDSSATFAFEDRIQGHCEFAAASLGDPILMRRDGLAAYQLAVVVDDAFQGISDVVRGADLLKARPGRSR